MNIITAPDMREASDTYVRTIHLAGKHRVALCKDGIQYLLQRRYEDRGKASWRSLRFCVTAHALAREWVNISGCAPPPEIMELPDAWNATNRFLRPYTEAG